MRAAVLAAVVLASAGLLAGCGTRHSPRTLTLTTLHGGILEPTSTMEQKWFAMLGFTPNPPAATSVRADRRAESIRRAVQEPGVRVVSLRIYSTPSLASPLAPALMLEVSRPAYSLRHQLKQVLPLLTENRSAYYLRVDGGRIRNRVLEGDWSPRGAAWYIAAGLESCSPISLPGPAFARVPPCPSK
jgi:hypothetical protein